MAEVMACVGVRRRLAVGLGGVLLAVALAGGASIGPARAQSDGPILAQAGVRDFDIAAQPLSEAVIQFGRQSGLQVVVQVDAAQGLQTRGVRGRMTSEQALAALLAGTGLAYRVTGSLVVVEKLAAGSSGALQLDPVQVQGAFPVPAQAMIDNIPPPYAGGQVATGGQLGLLGNRDVMDTPFNQRSYTAKKAQDQQARTVRDVLIDDPSVRFYRPDGSWGDNDLRIRGFPVFSASTTYGGLYGMLPTSLIMAELAERIEVLNGPNAFLNGMNPQNGIGGTVNVVPKRAPSDPLTQLTAGYASAGQFGGHADIARRFGSDQQFGVRFNGVFRAGQTAIEWNSDQRALALLGLDFRGERVRLSADLGYQYGYIGGVLPMLGPLNNVPLPYAPNASQNYGQPWNRSERKDLFGVVRGEVDLTERITAYASFGAHDFRAAELLGGDNVAISNINGNGTSTPYNLSGYATYVTGQAGLRGFVDTGPIGHEVAISASTLTQDMGNGFTFGTPFATNIYTPNVIAPPNLATPAATKTSTTVQSSLAFADTLSAADKRIQLTPGLRLQRVASTNFNPTSGAQLSNYDQSALSPSVSLVFKPWENVSVYGNWIQGLQQGAIVPQNFTNAGEVFPPYKSTQYEAGVKVDWGKLTTTFSAFQITRPSILTNVATNTQFLGGQQRNQGLELNFFGAPIEGVRLLGGAMLLDAVLAQTQGGLTNGWIAPFSAGTQLNLAGEWDLPFLRGLTVTGRVIYTGSQYIDTTWPRRTLAPWTRFDIGARYAFENPGAKGKIAVIRFNIENLFDADYWAEGNSAPYLSLGAPRIFRLSLTADF